MKPVKTSHADVVEISKIHSKNWNLIADLSASTATIDLEYSYPNRKTSTITLKLNIDHKKPYVLRHRTCPEYDIKVPLRSKGKHLFIGYTCEEDKREVRFHFITSGDATFDKTKNKRTLDFRFRKSQENIVYARRIARLSTIDEKGKRTPYTLIYQPAHSPRRWDLSAGLQATQMNYEEDVVDLDLKQNVMTAKMTFQYRLIPKHLDFDLTAFGTLLVLNRDPTDVPGSRFFGLSGRFGYRLPIDLGATEWHFLGGWYYWSMHVKDDSYGVNPLSGPQVFTQFSRQAAGSRAWSAYAKFASISNDKDFAQTRNREVAVGVAIGFTRAPKALMLTLDISDTRFSEGKNSMKLKTVGMGISKKF